MRLPHFVVQLLGGDVARALAKQDFRQYHALAGRAQSILFQLLDQFRIFEWRRAHQSVGGGIGHDSPLIPGFDAFDQLFDRWNKSVGVKWVAGKAVRVVPSEHQLIVDMFAV